VLCPSLGFVNIRPSVIWLTLQENNVSLFTDYLKKLPPTLHVFVPKIDRLISYTLKFGYKENHPTKHCPYNLSYSHYCNYHYNHY
jgi:hypothetical protein